MCVSVCGGVGRCELEGKSTEILEDSHLPQAPCLDPSLANLDRRLQVSERRFSGEKDLSNSRLKGWSWGGGGVSGVRAGDGVKLCGDQEGLGLEAQGGGLVSLGWEEGPLSPEAGRPREGRCSRR